MAYFARRRFTYRRRAFPRARVYGVVRPRVAFRSRLLAFARRRVF